MVVSSDQNDLARSLDKFDYKLFHLQVMFSEEFLNLLKILLEPMETPYGLYMIGGVSVASEWLEGANFISLDNLIDVFEKMELQVWEEVSGARKGPIVFCIISTTSR